MGYTNITIVQLYIRVELSFEKILKGDENLIIHKKKLY